MKDDNIVEKIGQAMKNFKSLPNNENVSPNVIELGKIGYSLIVESDSAKRSCVRKFLNYHIKVGDYPARHVKFIYDAQYER